ncbi:MAG TPA: segregation/condensation protein A [Polyangiaceae bacterium]|nr:segregation/condensation protein A [Polyangiaceae bacterium]
MTESQPPPNTPAAAPPAEGESVVGAYRVALPTFEGPLDLLLHLIEEHELDIRDIPIAFIAQKYVEYIMLMNELNIDVASEYLVMAATLAHIKSKSLLPTPPADDEEDAEDELDPRAELIRRLLEYQKYKHAGENLAAHDVLGRDVFPRGMPAPSVDGPAPITGLSLFKLLDAFQSVLSRAKATVDHQIDFERFSITDRINELSDILRVRPKLTFEELFEDQRSRAELIVTFLALLEMTRLRLTRLFQDGPLELIYIELSVSDDENKPSDDESTAEDGQESQADVSPADNALEADPAPDPDEADDLEQSDAGEDDGVLPDAER